MNQANHDLFLLMLNLSQMRSADRIKTVFMDAMGNAFPSVSMRYREETEDADASSRDLIAIATTNQSFGYLEVEGDGDVHVQSLIHNAAGLLAVILERLGLDKRLADENLNLEMLVEERTAALAEANIDLRRHREHLEELVADRTDELVRQNQRLQQTLRELETAQDRLIQSEKLAVLGRLAAGIAHEINNPLGAITSITGTLKTAVGRVTHREARHPSFGSEPLDGMLADAIEKAASGNVSRGSRENRELRDALEPRLAERGIADAHEVAQLLIDLDAHEEFERFLPVFRRDDAAQLRERTRDLLSIHRGIQVIDMASQRAARIIFALNNYARKDQGGEIREVDLRESIESVFLLYDNKIKGRVEIEREFEDIPPVECRGDQVCQVWTNLIHNALQAMDYDGRLTVAVRREDDRAVVTISDTGCGIPEAIQDRIFEPFFTTKTSGDGCGLGLDIVRSIVERHHGKIGFDTTPDEGTTFTVSLPFRQSPRAARARVS